jgi:hypothetical protein
MMDRREFAGALTLALVSAPRAALGQQAGKV